jgi:hypothetical protein
MIPPSLQFFPDVKKKEGKKFSLLFFEDLDKLGVISALIPHFGYVHWFPLRCEHLV